MLGIRPTDEPLDHWPEERIRRYKIVIDTVATWEQAQIEIANQAAERKAAAASRR